MHIHIINGPNLNLLGKREPEIYGSSSFEEYLTELKKQIADCEITYFQSNIEGEIVTEIQKADAFAHGIILNPGGYSHTSVAIADAIASIKTKVVEVHISNVHAREDFRKNLITATKAVGVISGLGLQSYALAISFFRN
jgi:3-dehydroquinate dehydratase-2